MEKDGNLSKRIGIGLKIEYLLMSLLAILYVLVGHRRFRAVSITIESILLIVIFLRKLLT